MHTLCDFGCTFQTPCDTWRLASHQGPMPISGRRSGRARQGVFVMMNHGKSPKNEGFNGKIMENVGKSPYNGGF